MTTEVNDCSVDLRCKDRGVFRDSLGLAGDSSGDSCTETFSVASVGAPTSTVGIECSCCCMESVSGDPGDTLVPDVTRGDVKAEVNDVNVRGVKGDRASAGGDSTARDCDRDRAAGDERGDVTGGGAVTFRSDVGLYGTGEGDLPNDGDSTESV